MAPRIAFKPDCGKKLSQFRKRPESIRLIWEFYHHLYLQLTIAGGESPPREITEAAALLRTPLHDTVYGNERSRRYKRYFLAKNLDVVLGRLTAIRQPLPGEITAAVQDTAAFLRILNKVISQCAC